jgi:hypothetical protein
MKMTLPDNWGQQFGKICSLLVHMLNNPTKEDREFVLHMLDKENDISNEFKELILSNVKQIEPDTFKKDDDSRFEYSLNESIKNEFNRFIK